jgi:hypothetical protein
VEAESIARGMRQSPYDEFRLRVGLSDAAHALAYLRGRGYPHCVPSECPVSESIDRANVCFGAINEVTSKDRLSAGSRNAFILDIGAGEGIRTLDPNLGKVVLYH